jgi:purine-binding chemotaxis protein CheW
MTGELQMVGFRVGQQSYALPISTVREIVRPPEITAVPQSPAHVAGVMNLRGRILPVVDLRKRFSQVTESSSKNRVLVVAADGKLIGLLVDAASEVLKVAAEAIEPSPKLFGESNERYVTGVAKHLGHLVILLDADKLLPESERVEAVPA